MKKLLQAKVSCNGIKVDGINFFHPALCQYEKQEVIIVLKKKNLDAFTLNGAFICKAKSDYFDRIYVGSDSGVTPVKALLRFSALSKSS